MPPSGYNKNQAESLSDFLLSCVDALVQENRGLREPHTAIKREIDSINRDLRRETRPEFERFLLGLTKSFYEALLPDCPRELDILPHHAEQRMEEFRSRILSIHVAT